MGKNNWSLVLDNACHFCEALHSCYPEKDGDFATWAAGESKPALKQERKAAALALQKLGVSRDQLPGEHVDGSQFLGYYVEDRHNLYTEDSFKSCKEGLLLSDVELKPNVHVTTPYSQEPQDMLAVRQNGPLQLVAVSWVGTQHRCDLMPWHIRQGQGLAKFKKSADPAMEGRGMTSYMRRTVLTEDDLDAKVEKVKRAKKDAEMARKLKGEQNKVNSHIDDDDDDQEDDDVDDRQSSAAAGLPQWMMGRMGGGGRKKMKKIIKQDGNKQTPSKRGRNKVFETPPSKSVRSQSPGPVVTQPVAVSRLDVARKAQQLESEKEPILQDAASGPVISENQVVERHEHPPQEWVDVADKHLWNYWDIAYGKGNISKSEISKAP